MIDINNPFIPLEVRNSILAGYISHMCKTHYNGKGVEVPDELKHFVAKYPEEIREEWYKELYSHLDKMSDELMERWIDAIPFGWQRYNLIECLDKRKRSQ